LELQCPDIGLVFQGSLVEGKEKVSEAALNAFLHLCELLGVHGGSVWIRSEIPVGAGLGSSASYSVCISTALLLLSGRMNVDEIDREIINQFAFEAEKVIHGNPSGVDNTVSTFGGANRYVKGEPLRPLIGFTELKFLCTDTRVEKNTKLQVSKFGDRINHFAAMQSIVDAIGAISEQCIELFSQYHDGTITHVQVEDQIQVHSIDQTLIQMNQGLLYASGMSHSVIDAVVARSSQLGLQTKMTGAGGGGCLLTFLTKEMDTQRIQDFQKQLEQEGMVCFETKLGVRGITVIQLDHISFFTMSFIDLRNKLLL
jgi:mevalonate kinase